MRNVHHEVTPQRMPLNVLTIFKCCFTSEDVIVKVAGVRIHYLKLLLVYFRLGQRTLLTY